MAVEDIIFGKNRHMFGGIEPSNMIVFEAVESTVQSGVVKINVQIPEDTTIDGQVLCTIAGAVIVRRYDRYPKDEFDGDVVATITDRNPTMIQDFPMSEGDEYKTCFYAAFPYSTQGVYNRNTGNRTMVNKPKDLATFTSRPIYDPKNDTSGISIYGSFEKEDGIGTVSGITIRRSTSGYPMNEQDGEYVTNIEYSNTDFLYEDYNEITSGIVYYYTAFPYNSYGVYSRDTVNKTSSIARSSANVYGYDLDTNDSNPSTRVTYPIDVDNALYTPVSYTGVKNDTVDTYSFSYGGWENAAFMPKPCILNFDGTVYEYLDPNNYKNTISGTPSRVTDISFNGNAMMEWGKIWTKRWEDEDGIYHFRCSDYQVDDDYDCWCNYDKDNNQIDHFYTAIYPSYNKDNIGRSVSGQIMTTGVSPYQCCHYACNVGSGWICEPLSDRLLIQDLLVLIGKSTDTQTVFGGVGPQATVKSGLMDETGLFGIYGSNVKVFGMESWWNHNQRYVHGWALPNRINNGYTGYQVVKITAGTHDGSDVSGFDVLTYGTSFSSSNVRDYRKCSEMPKLPIGPTDTTSIVRYIKNTITYPFGRLPYYTTDDDAGSASTYECDSFQHRTIKQDANQDTWYAACVGNGYTGSDEGYLYRTGAFYSYLDLSPTTSSTILGFALAYKANSTQY